jgi:outer membrane protein TolC
VRQVYIAADSLRGEVSLLGSASMGGRRSSAGSASQDDAELRPDRGSYSALLNIDLPLERTAERNAYRESLIDLERTVRSLQALEDDIKLAIRGGLRDLQEAREAVITQAEAVRLAERRVHSTDLFLQAGRAEIRDVLESQDALLCAQNALTSAVVGYRVAELELQRDMGLLKVRADGLWLEYTSGE